MYVLFFSTAFVPNVFHSDKYLAWVNKNFELFPITKNFLSFLYSSSDMMTMIKSRRLRLAWHVAHRGHIINAYKILIRKPEGKRLFGKSVHR
jgi:hypothetical protein